jgi:hypothetical protein
MNVNHTQQICEFCKSGECSGKLPENLLMIFGLFALIWVLLAICCSIPKINKYVTKFLEFLAFWPSMLYDWLVSRRMNKKMKNVVNEDPDEKYIKIFDQINNGFIYYNDDNFFQKINNKFLKIPFDSEITNFKLKEGNSLFIWKMDEIFSNECYNYKYILNVDAASNFKYSKDRELTEKFKSYCKKNEKVRYYVENL